MIIPTKNFIFTKGPFIKCSYKANDGVLYFLEKSILFVHKPVIDIEHESIKEIDLAIEFMNLECSKDLLI